MLVKRANSLLTYAPTGHYKTTNVGRFARYEYERTGKRTRLISADGGGWAPCQAEIDVGIIEPLRIVEADQPLPLLRKLSQGYWPNEAGNTLTLAGLDDVGAYAIEGIQSISTLLLRYIVASGRKISQEVIGLFQEKINVDNKDVNVSFGAASPSHYGLVQNEVLQLIANFRALPVDRVLFTSAEAKGKDDINDNSTVYGPASIGKALTDKLPFEFGDLLHFSSVPVGNTGKMEVRCYLVAHPDLQTKIIWPAKPRLQPSQLKAFDKLYPEGYYVLTPERGIEEFLRFQDESREGLAQDARMWKASIDAARGQQAEEVSNG